MWTDRDDDDGGDSDTWSEYDDDESDGEEMYEVNAILEQHGAQYLVEWGGEHMGSETWEPLANVCHCDAYKEWMGK